MKWILRSALPLVFALLLATPVAADDLLTLVGKKSTGQLQSYADGVITFSSASGVSRVAVKDIQSITLGKSPTLDKTSKFDEIELIDGSVIRCTAFKMPGKMVEPAFLPGDGPAPTAEVPLNTLFSVLRNANDDKNRAAWQKLLASRGKRDLLVIKSQETLNSVPGTVISGDDTGEAIRFERESDGQTVSYKLSRATGGLVFNQPPRGVIPPTLCRVVDTSGNVWTAQTFVVADGGLAVKTVAGATVRFAKLSSVAMLDFSQGNLLYLSDLSPQVDAPPPVPGEPYFTYISDKTDERVPLKLDGITYQKGLWVFPETALTYTLPGDYREFKAVIGVDDSVQVATSTVKLTIETDGRVVYSQTIARKDKPRNLTLDVKGAKTLTFRVEPVGLYLGNQINIADARVQK